MPRTFIQLGKFGDVISVLPLLHAEFQSTGDKPNLIVCKEYADVLHGISYLTPQIYPGHWSDLSGAIKWAKQNFDEVLIPQTHGNTFPIENKTPSFQQEQYQRCGCLDKWDALPTIFDQRNKQREYALTSRVIGRKKCRLILIGDNSESAPFESVEELVSMVQSNFGGTHKIIRLSTIRAEHICDLIGLYDKAEVLVSVDTVHVHLAKASKVPKIVLARDGWVGAAYSKEFMFYMKYSQWKEQKDKFIGVVGAATSR